MLDKIRSAIAQKHADFAAREQEREQDAVRFKNELVAFLQKNDDDIAFQITKSDDVKLSLCTAIDPELRDRLGVKRIEQVEREIKHELGIDIFVYRRNGDPVGIAIWTAKDLIH